MNEPTIAFVCTFAPPDSVDFEYATEDSEAPYGVRLYRHKELRGSAYLTHEQARELFSWLGVQLHRHRPGP